MNSAGKAPRRVGVAYYTVLWFEVPILGGLPSGVWISSSVYISRMRHERSRMIIDKMMYKTNDEHI